MLKNINPTQTVSWIKLAEHFEEIKHIQISNWFDENPNRADEFSLAFDDVLVLSLIHISEPTRRS